MTFNGSYRGWQAVTGYGYIPCMNKTAVNTLRPRQNGHLFADDIFKCISLNENIWISIKISLKFVPKCVINNIPALVQIMTWRRPGDKPLSEPLMVRLPTNICVTRPQWVKGHPRHRSTLNGDVDRWTLLHMPCQAKRLWRVKPLAVAALGLGDNNYSLSFYQLLWNDEHITNQMDSGTEIVINTTQATFKPI